MSFPPNVYLIGAQQSGTDSLASQLSQHPDVCLSNPKEPDYFNKNWGKGLQWYRQCFREPNKPICIDASSSYTLAPLDSIIDGEVVEGNYAKIPKKIFDLVPSAKFIYMLREPVARVYSAYWHSVRADEESRSFKQILEEAMILPANSYYLRGSEYYDQLLLYLKYFRLDAFKIVFFEDFRSNPVAVTQECFHFLGLNDNVELKDVATMSKSYTLGPFGKWSDKLLSGVGGLKKITNLVKPLLPKPIKNIAINLLSQEIPIISDDDKLLLSEHYRESIVKLEELLGFTITQWK